MPIIFYLLYIEFEHEYETYKIQIDVLCYDFYILKLN